MSYDMHLRYDDVKWQFH